MTSISLSWFRASKTPAIPVVTLGWALSTFFAFSYVLCLAGYFLFPSLPVEHAMLAVILPGFNLGSWPSFFLGFAETIVWGWYIALVFGSLYNSFAAK